MFGEHGEVVDGLREQLAALAALIASVEHEELSYSARDCLTQVHEQVRDMAELCRRLPDERSSLEWRGLEDMADEDRGRGGVGRSESGGSTGAVAMSVPVQSAAATAGARSWAGPTDQDQGTVVICDHHRMFGESLAIILGSRGYNVVACTSDPGLAVDEVSARRPDILVIDLHSATTDGVGAIRAALDASPATRVIVLSGTSSRALCAQARGAGAVACLTKQADMGRILDGIKAVADGHQVFDPAAERAPLAHTAGHDPMRSLTGREREVLERLVRGQQTATIATEMGMAHSTTRSHIQRVLSKLGAHSRLEAVSLATAGPRRKTVATTANGSPGIRQTSVARERPPGQDGVDRSGSTVRPDDPQTVEGSPWNSPRLPTGRRQSPTDPRRQVEPERK